MKSEEIMKLEEKELLFQDLCDRLPYQVKVSVNGAYIPISNKTKDEIVAEYYDWIKKQSEQTHMTKTNDKELEPKLKVGDWVVSNNDGEVWQIGSIYYITGQCCFLYNKNRDRIGVTKEELDSNFHLWTIKDAKEGDVLVDSYSKDSTIILYKGIYKERTVLAHCGWNGYNLSVNKNGFGYGGLDNTNYLPATKEQRDLLFQKMKQAGYEWDSKNKELKRIGHKTLDSDKVIAWLVANICGFEYYVKLFKKDFGL